MDDVVNRFARELADAIAAAVADRSTSRSVPREGARRGLRDEGHSGGRGRLREPLAVCGADQGDHHGSGACGTAPVISRSPPTIGGSSGRFESQPTKRPRKSTTNSSNARKARNSNRKGPVRRGGPAFFFGSERDYVCA